ncbi:MAG: orotidine-5'-phosphate decarboxylase [Bacteroidales bacterium]|jgi:orotidine-5'-phosphate decarboxylase|nr:orotidine-5'-phosphate decarboxylase [Bacteroidales bacterium]MCK9498769.1 orotidine-5'-phosphate decarboxylase [Bacteroidales bacterium]MDY0314307.1 orotidine-5'-phosphate decarboxylase [Bacteroidales bacterium]NLB85908.1 orotidine-5'-phosphate decarboxylase [Bacteroidales bacterium]
MNYKELFEQIKLKQSFLCLGLDSDFEKLPKHLLSFEFPVFEFNKQIIDASVKYVVAYKPNLAFYESLGLAGWQSLEMTVDYIRDNYPEIFIIADAKRGDIGNTSKLYAKAFFEKMNFDAITVAPYMGEDSVKPFLTYKNKWLILLALTSNIGADDFQYFSENKQRLFEKVLEKSQDWGDANNMMYVVGATRAEMLKDVRKIVPNHFLLVPGIGAQGGSLQEVAKYGMNENCGLLVNSSRAIIFADSSENFAITARIKAQEVQDEMRTLLKAKEII